MTAGNEERRGSMDRTIMNRTIKTGFIGCGGIIGSHLQAIRDLTGIAIVAFCDVDRGRAERCAKEYGAGDVYTDYRAMLSRGDLDAVHIVTPHHLHARMSLDALGAGLFVLCEKPMAITLGDARALIDADCGGKLCVVFQTRLNPATVEAKRLIASGELGAFLTARAMVAWSRDQEYYAAGEWRGRWATAGGGSLINQAIHTIDLMQYLCGPFAAIKGSVSTDLLTGVVEVEDNTHAVIRFAGGQTGLLYTSNNFGITELPQIVMVFENGTLTLQGTLLTLARGERVSVLYNERMHENGGKPCYGSGHAPLIAKFYDSVRGGAPMEVSGQDGYPALWAVLGIYESSRTGKWVEYK